MHFHGVVFNNDVFLLFIILLVTITLEESEDEEAARKRTSSKMPTPRPTRAVLLPSCVNAAIGLTAAADVVVVDGGRIGINSTAVVVSR